MILTMLLLSSSLARAETNPSTAERCVQHYAAVYRVPPEMIAAFIDVESRWNPHALSSKGAIGLMQLMPATARRFGAFQPFDVEHRHATGMGRAKALWRNHSGTGSDHHPANSTTELTEGGVACLCAQPNSQPGSPCRPSHCRC